MKLVKPSAEILERIIPNVDFIEKDNLLGFIYEAIEIAGRTCYKSEDKITANSAKAFVEMLIIRGHTAMLEHGTVYLFTTDTDTSYKYHRNKYSKIVEDTNGQPSVFRGTNFYITTNYRVLVENDWLDDLQYLCPPTEHHEKRISVRFICDRGISHELVRHRVFSFAQESTRFCNYTKDKFGNEITFVLPYSFENDWEFEGSMGAPDENFKQWICQNKEIGEFLKGLYQCEESYFKLVKQGWQPQQARAILPNALKTEVIMSGFLSDWEHFFNLRCAPNAHPQMKELAIPLYEQFKERNLL